MATKGAQAAEDRSSSDSDDSMTGPPNFSAEERGLPDDLLKNSNEFIRLYEKHQPELQQNIKDLEKSSDEFLCKYEEATRQSRAGRMLAGLGALGAGAGAGLCLALAPFTLGTSLLVGAVVVGAGAIYSLKGNRNKHEEEEKALEDVKKALQTFKTTARIVTKHLHNVCNQVEEILQYQIDEQSRLLKSEVRELRKHTDVWSQLAKLFKSADLQRLLMQGTRTIAWTGNINPMITILLDLFDFLYISEDERTLRDFEKLKNKQSGMQVYELESKAGRFIWTMRETINHFQNTLNEIITLKTEVENTLLPKLNKFATEKMMTRV
ncbi:uncharacterized protein LOC108442567 [Pygocentrus nattereri]|uniref:uncharacterized protein LOC108442567 n=1 Tax=Pygocentrus nattereri TaxID=42514 RepID=UPI00081452B1|nr:uncharacterized protein LOC108442567 [Pygocentrus nattereri]XP_037393283.1 uncharacterized protein LOC108442567 [Pygocentrus nattereri]